MTCVGGGHDKSVGVLEHPLGALFVSWLYCPVDASMVESRPPPPFLPSLPTRPTSFGDIQ